MTVPAQRPYLLAAGVVVGCGVLWIGIPAASFYLSGRLTSSATGAVLIALILTPAAMVAFGWLLYRINVRYEALRGPHGHRNAPPAWRGSLGEERRTDRLRQAGRPLIEIAMTVSAIAAMLALLAWFVFAPLRLGPLP
ncbi:MAG TPA: hypothetical protein VHJ37_06255 [Thermoleophilaceae bacterium]|nr:hypothetical protein [Thermoleophilaceae bacterium]